MSRDSKIVCGFKCGDQLELVIDKGSLLCYSKENSERVSVSHFHKDVSEHVLPKHMYKLYSKFINKG